jgi:predicted transcriptional regulator of viral defense system
MQYVLLREYFKEYTIFSLNDIRQLEPTFHRRRLNDWQDKGYIRKIIKEFYIFADKNIDEYILFEIANRIYKPSYVSLETALSYYQFIPESVYGITSVSTKRTYRFHTDFGNFLYRTLRPDLFFGYELVQSGHKYIKIAEPEKAVLDYIYLNPHLRKSADFDSLRINDEIFFQQIDLEKIEEYSQKYRQKTFYNRTKNFIRFLISQRDRNHA